MDCSEAVKLAGFKSRVEVAELASVSVKGLYNDFNQRFSLRFTPKFPAKMRRAMDEKQRRERVIMELAIKKIMEKEVG